MKDPSKSQYKRMNERKFLDKIRNLYLCVNSPISMVTKCTRRNDGTIAAEVNFSPVK